MAGWTCHDKNDIYWNGRIIADNIKGDGSEITSVVHSVLDAYPVGAIYISVSSTSPATLFGGTWVAFGAGKVLVSLNSGDADFDTSEETGGAKTHSHSSGTLATDTEAAHTHGTDSTRNLGIGAATQAVAAGTGVQQGAHYNHSHVISGTTETGGSHSHDVDSGSTDSSSSLQPYIVVYMWKRTA